MAPPVLLPEPPLAARERVHRPDGIAASKVCRPCFLRGILAVLEGDPFEFRPQTVRITDWRQHVVHPISTDTRRDVFGGKTTGRWMGFYR